MVTQMLGDSLTAMLQDYAKEYYPGAELPVTSVGNAAEFKEAAKALNAEAATIKQNGDSEKEVNNCLLAR